MIIKWKEWELPILRKGIAQRKTATAIGKRLGRSKNSIIGKANKMGLSWHLSKAERADRGKINALKNPKRFAWAAGQKGTGGIDTRWGK